MAEFTPDFKDFYKDLTRWRDLHCPFGPTFQERYLEGLKLLTDRYYEREAWDPLVERYGATAEKWPSPELERIVNTLRGRRDVRRLKSLFLQLIAGRKNDFWEFHGLVKAGHISKKDAATLPRDKEELLTLLNDARRIMADLGDTRYADRLAEEHACIEQEVRRKPPKPIERAMDEDCFWELIDNARSDAESMAEQMEHLTTALEAFKATEIKKFALLLEGQMDALAHWDVWALGYVAMEGCSDDSFDYFREWLILQGRDFVGAVRRDVQQLKRLPGGRLGVSGLLSIPQVAYDGRAGKPLKLPKRKASKVKGEEWDEADLPKRYPALCKLYDYAA